MIVPMIDDASWAGYERDGFLPLGRVLDAAGLAELSGRINGIMLGTAPVPYDRLLMQLDGATGKYEDAGEQSLGFKGPTLAYRKIQELEHDPLFLRFMQAPRFREICARVYGSGAAVSSFRAMFMNKPARQGTKLPWHQDRWSYLDRDPLITIWTALDPATRANGCVEIIRGSHRAGLINPAHGSGFLEEQHVREHVRPELVEYLELEAGEAVLLHNWLLHSSDVNRTDVPRRAFSVCYMDARTRTKDGRPYPMVFGEGALVP